MDTEESRREITEDSAIDELLKLIVFQKYYESPNINKIKPIYWDVDPKLPEGAWGMAMWVKKGSAYIPKVTLESVPIKAEHVGRIAHEIQHLLLDKEGFPRVVCSNRVLTMAIKGMVQDPLVNLRLRPYGFDVKRDHMEMLQDYRGLLIKQGPTSPTEDPNTLLLAINYVRNVLRWETAFDDNHQEDNDFQKWFHKDYPDIARKGMKLLRLVRGTGYETPDLQLKLLNKIGRRYSIEMTFEPPP